MRISILLLFLTMLLSSHAKADETYFCYMNRLMEVFNNGDFFGSEETEQKLILKVSDGVVSHNLYDAKIEMPIIHKAGISEFAAKGGVLPTDTLHVWRLRIKENNYSIQITDNRDSSIIIRTGSCILND